MKERLPISLALISLAVLVGPAQAQRLGGRTSVFDGADTDHDGRISRAEFAAAREKDFDRLDRNHDGVVSRDDFARLLKFRPQAGSRLDNWIAARDTNHDGKMMRAELQAAPMSVFDRADANHDGFVDQKELSAFRDPVKSARDKGGL
jgi:Ca2+-binding EF-hand superfamily protein